MSSIVPGYAYDIFISYRHKDNKYDGWVTEFVNNLKQELEATFKEQVSIYFDANPLDGLHETHDVDDSLREKIKCLIFIPIVSRTYCDESSFAWSKEFIAFRDFALQEPLGLKVTLLTGNVANRILPVRIHDLDPEDVQLFEKESAGVLRPVDFIFKSLGVNRPLLPQDDRKENVNHTYYRDQINKLAMAIKEIVAGVRRPGARNQATSSASTTSPHSPTRRSNKYLVPTLIIGLLAIVGFGVTYWLTSDKDTVDNEIESALISDRSIAVLPFVNISNDKEQEYFSDGITEQIIAELSQIRDLKVIARTSIMKYKNSQKSIVEIAADLHVTHILEGSVRKAGDRIRISAKLIEVKGQSNLWVHDYDENLSDIFRVQDEVSGNIATFLKNKLSPIDLSDLKAAETKNPEAYEHYLKGTYLHNQYYVSRHRPDFFKTESAFKKAIELDATYALAYAGLADLYDTQAWTEKKYILKRDSLAVIAFRLAPRSPYVLMAKSFTFSNNEFPNPTGNMDSTYKYLMLAYGTSPNNSEICHELSGFMRRVGLHQIALPLAQHLIELDPVDVIGQYDLGFFYYELGDLQKAEKYVGQSLALDPDFIFALRQMISIHLVRNEIKQAQVYLEKLRTINKDDGSLRYFDAFILAVNKDKAGSLKLGRNEFNYIALGMYTEAVEYIRVNRQNAYTILKNHPFFNPLRGRQDFAALLESSKKEYETSALRFPFKMK